MTNPPSIPILPCTAKPAEEILQHRRIEGPIWNVVAQDETLYHEIFQETGTGMTEVECPNDVAAASVSTMTAIHATAELGMRGAMDIKITTKEAVV